MPATPTTPRRLAGPTGPAKGLPWPVPVLQPLSQAQSQNVGRGGASEHYSTKADLLNLDGAMTTGSALSNVS